MVWIGFGYLFDLRSVFRNCLVRRISAGDGFSYSSVWKSVKDASALCQGRTLAKSSGPFYKCLIFNQMKATPSSHLTIIPAFPRKTLITVLTSIIFESDTDFLYVSRKNEPPLSCKATIFDQSRSTIFRTIFSYKALKIFFRTIKTDLTCKHIRKTYDSGNSRTVIHTSSSRYEV